MKNLKKILAGTLASALVVLGVGAFSFTSPVNAMPWSESTTGLDRPGFNVFTGVPGYGNESDFMRGRVSGSSNAFADPVNDACADGTQYSIQMYVHNGANQTLNNNGSGPGVAHGTMVKVGVPQTTANKINGTISASNASSVNDTLTINCNGKTMQLSYVQDSAVQQRTDGSTAPLNNSIVTTGAPIGTQAPNGDMWGCFEQRVIVYLKVQVKEIPTPPKPSKGECKVLDIKPLGGRKIEANLSGTTDNAQIVGYEINWGDGSKSDKQKDTHEYAKDGTYIITGKVKVKYADGKEEWKGGNDCAKQITFKPDVPPTPTPVPPTPTPTPPVTPTTLPSTGPGEVVAIFTAISIAAGVAYRIYIARRLGA